MTEDFYPAELEKENTAAPQLCAPHLQTFPTAISTSAERLGAGIFAPRQSAR